MYGPRPWARLGGTFLVKTKHSTKDEQNLFVNENNINVEKNTASQYGNYIIDASMKLIGKNYKCICLQQKHSADSEQRM